MSKDAPDDDPHQQSEHASHKQTDKPWKGNPEKEQRNDDAEIDLEKWHETKIDLGGAAAAAVDWDAMLAMHAAAGRAASGSVRT
jgi:hypothetical protein